MVGVVGRRPSRGQSTVEFAASAIVLVLLLVGLIDLGRSFYFDVALHGATREAARQATWFDANTGTNPTLYDNDTAWTSDPCKDPTPGIKQVVDCNLQAALMPSSILVNPVTTCPDTADGNPQHDPPYIDAAYAGAPENTPLLYICYRNAPGTDMTTPPTDSSAWATDVNVILLMRFASVTGLMTNLIGPVHMASNTHMVVGGFTCAGGCS